MLPKNFASPGRTAFDRSTREERGPHPDSARRLAEEYGCDVVDLGEVEPEPDAVAAVPREIAARYGAVPLDLRGGILRVAVTDPFDTASLDALGEHLQRVIEPVVAPREQILPALERAYGRSGGSSEAEGTGSDEGGRRAGSVPVAEAVEEDGGAADEPVIAIVRQLMAEAIRQGASDIHVEPFEQRVRVRYRVDGVLREVAPPPKHLQLAIVSHLKLRANVSIAEKRVPQDGRLQVVQDGRPVDLRVSTLPTVHGESIVLRVLERDGLRRGLPELGFSADDRARFEEQLSRPDGMLLVTGPTGSGKSTTLYSALSYLNHPDRKIITVEDPVEYRLPGINQVAVRPETGMTFAAALRAMLRQAPDVVMIGEIRDRETTDIAIQAALTGHLVFSTLHTNDAPGAITRLIDLGAKSFLVAGAVRAVLAQRLVRRVCEGCARPDPRALLDWPGLPPDAARPRGASCRRGTGCDACGGTGYRGRLAIGEIFIVNERIQAMIHSNASAAAIREAARSSGMRTLREDGLRRALSGLTTLEEVLSLTIGEPDPVPFQPSPTS